MKVDPPPLDVYRVMSDTIEQSILAGLRKAEKRDLLTLKLEDAAAEIVHSYVMADLEEVVRWPEFHVPESGTG